MDLSGTRQINQDQETFLVASFGSVNFESKSLVNTCRRLNVTQIFLVSDISEQNSDAFEIVKKETMRHFEYLDIIITFQLARIDNLHVEALFLAQSIATKYSGEKQIVIDSFTGHRYLRTLLIDAISWVLLLSQTFFKKQIFLYEALSLPNSTKTHFFSSQLIKINPHAFKILAYVEEGAGEIEIGEKSGIKQSTVSIHLKTLRRLDLIEGKTKKHRRKTIRGSILEEIHSILNDKITE